MFLLLENLRYNEFLYLLYFDRVISNTHPRYRNSFLLQINRVMKTRAIGKMTVLKLLKLRYRYKKVQTTFLEIHSLFERGAKSFDKFS
jgi:hypothetical protein